MNNHPGREEGALPSHQKRASQGRWASQSLCWTLAIPFFAMVGCVRLGKPDEGQRYVPPHEVKEFEPLYQQNCAGCHGRYGKWGPAPPLNDPLFLEMAPDAVLLATITSGRHGTPMPAFAREKGGMLTAEQVEILATGIKQHWKSTRIESEKVPAYIDKEPKNIKTSGEFEQIRKMVFARACASCHGNRGQGGTYGGKEDGQRVGAINEPAFLELITDQALRRYVITGRPDLGMPNYAEPHGRPSNFKPLTPEEVSDLVALLASWRLGGSPRVEGPSP